ncbi:MAG: alpha/beta fold hydrolase [Actinobacteria bacterium]|nr:alpha/beta fold hydrolase [Actinomycetota bacterium]
MTISSGHHVIPGADAFRFDAGPVGVLLLHGFTGSPASMRPLGERLAREGISSVGPRLPGHGTSWEDLEATTWSQWEGDADSTLLDLSSRCSAVIAVGLSAGAALALHLGVRQAQHLRGVVAINPQIRRPDLLLAPLIRPFRRTARGVGNDIRKPGQDEIAYDRVPLQAAGELRKLIRHAEKELPSLRLPLMVISSRVDHVVKPSNSRLVMRKAGSSVKELVRLESSYHVATLDHDSELISSRIALFVRSNANQTI